jgi:L-asparaginase
MSFNAFTSVNYPLPAIIRNDRIVREGREGMTIPGAMDGGSAQQAGRPRVYERLDEHVVVVRLTPGLGPGILDALGPDYDAVILETFGIGGIPECKGAHFEQAIFDWIDCGKTIVLTTQVSEEGLDLGVYEVGSAYANEPAILRGDDMTTEALVAKTMWALGQTREPAEVAKLFYRPVNHDRAVR